MTADEDLFREWQIGSAAALEILVRRYHAPLVAHLYRLVGDAHLAEDLTQETFVRLVRDANAYRYPRPFWPWLYTIARHLALSYHASAYYRHVELRAEVPETVALDPDPADWLVHWEELHGLQTAMLHLSFEQREVLSLRFGQEKSVKEIAVAPAGRPFRETIASLQGERLVILSTHIITDVEAMATNIVLLHEGQVLWMGTPAALQSDAIGSTWAVSVSAAEFEHLRATSQVSMAIRRGERVETRLIAPTRPHPDAINVEPTLEEAYLCLLSGDERIQSANLPV